MYTRTFGQLPCEFLRSALGVAQLAFRHALGRCVARTYMMLT